MYTSTTILGRAGRDAEMRYTTSGKSVTNLSVAADIGYGDNKRTIWFRVSCWNKLAVIVNQYVSKGDMLLIEGELSPDENGNPKIWEKKDGSASASYELTARTVKFLSTKKDREEYVDDGVPF